MSKLNLKKIPSRANIQELRSILRSHAANLQSLRKSLADARAIAEKKAMDSVSQISMTAEERRVFAKRQADSLVAQQRKGAKETAEKLARDLATARNVLELGKGIYDNPFAALDAATLGSARRATYMQNLASAGPMALKNAAERAASLGDAELAAAVIAVVSGMPTDKRPFHPAAVLDIFPEEHEVFAPMVEFEEAEAALADGLSLYGEVVNGTTNPTARIERALRDREAAAGDEGGDE
ncbi:hypothetical protein [Methylobacillus sp.]|uniref:hypothetical protein n=1 Tax=Methylobacillus sp. TaxID=56818 RepID=UPI0012BE18D3|nr:hypothetical protein [Methylobacillus sp.]MPS47873.1 hypothetical protein [Methylobacillus sp.]